MGWIYKQSTGEIGQNGQIEGHGYSGFGDSKNNPDHQDLHYLGPIPRGTWTISGPPVFTPLHGPYVLILKPLAKTETFGRSGFLIHGDSVQHAGAASQGCIILPRNLRESVWLSGDRVLTVVV